MAHVRRMALFVNQNSSEHDGAPIFSNKPHLEGIMIKATTSIRLAMSVARYFMYALTPKMALLLISIILCAGTAGAAQLRVMKMGLGSGTITSSPGGINCAAGSVVGCDATYAGGSVTLTATAASGSVFVRWEGDGTGTGTRAVTMSADRSVRPVFDLAAAIPTLTDFTPEGIQTYLTANPIVTTPARFLKALPGAFTNNWLAG